MDHDRRLPAMQVLYRQAMSMQNRSEVSGPAFLSGRISDRSFREQLYD